MQTFWTFTILDFEQDQREYDPTILLWPNRKGAVEEMWRELEVFEFGETNDWPQIKWNEDGTRGTFDVDFLQVIVYQMKTA